MGHSTTTRPGAPERQFVFGPERLRATILTTATETDGRHDLTDGVLPRARRSPCTCTPGTRSACSWCPAP